MGAGRPRAGVHAAKCSCLCSTRVVLLNHNTKTYGVRKGGVDSPRTMLPVESRVNGLHTQRTVMHHGLSQVCYTTEQYVGFQQNEHPGPDFSDS